jgi:hypothetical protein
MAAAVVQYTYGTLAVLARESNSKESGASMSLPCYACGQPADYSCVATDCDHQMCEEHSVVSVIGFVEPVPSGDMEGPDRQYYCLDHADLAQV